MRSMPSSVSFWTTHSGRSPLTGAKATVRAGSARASNWTAVVVPTSGSRVRSPCHLVRAQWPWPSAAMTSSPARNRSTRAKWWASASEGTGCAGSSTNTWAAAAARTEMPA